MFIFGENSQYHDIMLTTKERRSPTINIVIFYYYNNNVFHKGSGYVTVNVNGKTFQLGGMWQIQSVCNITKLLVTFNITISSLEDMPSRAETIPVLGSICCSWSNSPGW